MKEEGLHYLRFLPLLVVIFGCTKAKISTDDLSKNNELWTLVSLNHPDNSQVSQIMHLRFGKNGLAYEENRILKYPYKVHRKSGILELNHQYFEILKIQENKIVIRNTKTGIILTLTKE